MSHIVFEETKDAEVIRYTHLRNGGAWKGTLTLEQYADREGCLGRSNVAHWENKADGWGLRYFVLKDTTLPETSKTSQVVSALEILTRPGWLIMPGKPDEVLEYKTSCIGGVYTAEEHRGKGYAKIMINAINDYCEKEYGTDRHYLFLYSEVGDYYTQFGYTAMESPVHHFPLADVEKICTQEPDQPIRYLGYDGIEDLIELQKADFLKRMKQAARENPTKAVTTVEPTMEIYQWFHDRGMFISNLLNDGYKPTKFGAALPSKEHVIWWHHWFDHALYIVATHVESYESLLKLLKIAIQEANEHKLHELHIWDFELPREYRERLLKELDNPEYFDHQNGSISAIRFPQADIIWQNNTKFCWF